jgi:hypothetical protein
MIQISPQMRILVAVEAIDFRNGIDGLARICKEALQTDREQGMSPDERLHLHQAESGQRMKELEKWFKEQFTERKVEPNSGLGEAILYMQTHWNKLTLFLRQAGARWTTTSSNER